MGECTCKNCGCNVSMTLRYCSKCNEETSQVFLNGSWVCTVCQESDISLVHCLSGSK